VTFEHLAKLNSYFWLYTTGPIGPTAILASSRKRRIKGAAILDAELVCLDDKGVAQFDTLHSRAADQLAVACAFDLLMRGRGRSTASVSRLSASSCSARVVVFSTSNTPRATVTNYSRPPPNLG
jgi:hypothetical protein